MAVQMFSVLTPCFLIAMMYGIASSGVFDHLNNVLGVGLSFYAEPAWIKTFPSIMPLNTVVNFGYPLVGVHWWLFTRRLSKQDVLRGKDSVLFYTLNSSISLYGFVQFQRVVRHQVVWSVIDQWYTLALFATVFIWTLHLNAGISNTEAVLIFSVSLISYFVILATNLGFEITLTIHIILVVAELFVAHGKYPAQGSLRQLILTLLACSGFVVLKLLDFKLVGVFTGFRYVTGHFLSKICDVLQIHFVNKFLLTITLEKTGISAASENRTMNRKSLSKVV